MLSFDSAALAKRTRVYQEKIKRMLVSSDVNPCLLGERDDSKSLNLQRELAKVKLQVP